MNENSGDVSISVKDHPYQYYMLNEPLMNLLGHSFFNIDCSSWHLFHLSQGNQFGESCLNAYKRYSTTLGWQHATPAITWRQKMWNAERHEWPWERRHSAHTLRTTNFEFHLDNVPNICASSYFNETATTQVFCLTLFIGNAKHVI